MQSTRETNAWKAAAAGNWDEFIEHASGVPPAHDIWQQAPSAHAMPDHAINKVLDYLHTRQPMNKNSFVWELAHNLPHDIGADTLNKLAHHAMDDYMATDKIINHPNYKPNDRTKKLSSAVKWWNGYERDVNPSHFATIKSMFTGKPETVSHRGDVGQSQEHLIPHLRDHAKEIQHHILNDDFITKRTFNGKPHIKVFRGVNGPYAKAIKDRTDFNPETNTVSHKKFVIPTTHMSSWSTDPKQGSRFAWMRQDLNDKGEHHGIVMSQWVPVENILHSGTHKTVPGQEHPHYDEHEIVVAHPEGKMKITTADMRFQSKPKYDKGSTIPVNYGHTDYPVVKKTEEDLFKSWKAPAIAAATALTMMGVPSGSHPDLSHHHAPEANSSIQSINSQKDNEIQPHPELAPIAYIESSNGKNTTHRQITSGLNTGTSAIGTYGLMPLQVIDSVKYDKNLRSKYPDIANADHIKDQQVIRQRVMGDKTLKHSILNSHWERLRRKFDGDTNRMAYAWLHGISGAMKADDNTVKNSDYVKKYNTYSKLLGLEGKVKSKNPMAPPVKKSESDLIPDKYTGFTAIKPSNPKSANLIDWFVREDKIHPLKNVGHFTNSAFIVGTDAKNCWILKPESTQSPAASPVKNGLMSAREMAFSVAAKRVFGLSDLTPEVMMGILKKRKAVVNGPETHIPVAAIKMYGKEFIPLSDLEKKITGSTVKIMEKYNKTGELHQMAAMLYILGDLDAHGENVLVDPASGEIKLIDHGSSMADRSFIDKADDNVFMPYILRRGIVKAHDSMQEKMDKMPRIREASVRKNVASWLHSLDEHTLVNVVNEYGFDAQAAVNRLELLKRFVNNGMPVDQAINLLWVKVVGGRDEA